jgi:hypothetical protein
MVLGGRSPPIRVWLPVPGVEGEEKEDPEDDPSDEDDVPPPSSTPLFDPPLPSPWYNIFSFPIPLPRALNSASKTWNQRIASDVCPWPSAI